MSSKSFQRKLCMTKYSAGRQTHLNGSKWRWISRVIYIALFTLLAVLVKMGLLHFIGQEIKAVVRTYREIPQKYQNNSHWNVEIESAPDCMNGDALFLVKTARSNKILRDLIRRSNTLQTATTQIDSQLLFLVGQADSHENQIIGKNLKEEMEEYGDFIVGDFIDSYHNLTKKVPSLTDAAVCNIIFRLL